MANVKNSKKKIRKQTILGFTFERGKKIKSVPEGIRVLTSWDVVSLLTLKAAKEYVLTNFPHLEVTGDKRFAVTWQTALWRGATASQQGVADIPYIDESDLKPGEVDLAKVRLLKDVKALTMEDSSGRRKFQGRFGYHTVVFYLNRGEEAWLTYR